MCNEIGEIFVGVDEEGGDGLVDCFQNNASVKIGFKIKKCQYKFELLDLNFNLWLFKVKDYPINHIFNLYENRSSFSRLGKQSR